MTDNTSIDPRYLSYDKDEVQRILDSVAPHPEISADELLAQTLTDATIAKLKAMRQAQRPDAIILISDGKTLIPANIRTYGSTFEMYFIHIQTVSYDHPADISVRAVFVTADPNNNEWAVHIHDITSAIDAKIDSQAEGDPTSLIND